MRLLMVVLIIAIGAQVGLAQESLPKPPTDKFGQLVLPLTIRGKATNDKGEPVAGAKVFAHSMNWTRANNAPRVLAETTTDARGQYQFESVQIPVLDINQRRFPAPVAGKFQVYGLAPGYGHTWHPPQFLNQEKRPAEDVPPHNIYAAEVCVADLRFEPAATLSGIITADNGAPLAGVRVQVGQIDDDRWPGSAGPWSVRYLGPPGGEEPVQPDEFGAIIHLPVESRSAVTNEHGQFSIVGLRRETQYLARIGYLPEFDALSFSIATTERKLPGSVRSVGYAGSLTEKLIVPRTVTVVVTAGESDQPLAGVTVRVGGRKIRATGIPGKTDAAGQSILRLTPGKYKLHLDPPAGAPYVQTQADLTVAELPFEQAAPVALQAGATLELHAVEAGAGKPIAGVSFNQSIDSGTAATPLHSQTVFLDYATTNAEGKLRAVVPPGPRQILVAGHPPEASPLQKAGEIIVLKPGDTQSVRFEFKRSVAASPQLGAIDERLAKLAESVARQQALTRVGTFHTKSTHGLWQDVKIEDLRVIFHEFPRDKVPDLIAKLNEWLPQRQFRLGGLTMMTDGFRKRADTTYARHDGTAGTTCIAFNGRDTAQHDPSNAQASIYSNEGGSRMHVAGVEDLIRWPFFYRAVENQHPVLNIEQKDGLVLVTLQMPEFRIEQLLDAESGFLYHYLSESNQGSGTETWQFAPRKLPGGAILPGLSASFQFSVRRTTARISVLETADLSPPPASSFAVAAPSGTNVVDFRGNQRQPKSSVTSEPVPDVVARANAIADDRRSILPVVKIGDPAPPLDPVAWLTAAGKCDPPDLKGKVVLVDFWGINCGFCIIQLPEVQAVHRRLEAKGLIVLGMHDSSGEVEAVAQLAKKHGLSYLLAIDRHAPDGRGFGAACEAYGIRGIPNCAVIDQQGKVAFVGDFLSAAHAAKRLLAIKSP